MLSIILSVITQNKKKNKKKTYYADIIFGQAVIQINYKLAKMKEELFSESCLFSMHVCSILFIFCIIKYKL